MRYSKKLLGIVKKEKWNIMILFFIIFVAFTVRMYLIEDITPGMYPDEIAVAQNALALQKSAKITPFLGSYSHPTPLLYATAWMMDLFGHTVTAIRLPSVLFGSIAIIPLYFILRLALPSSIAFAATFLLVFQYAHLVLSRFAYEPAAALFFQLLCVLFFALYYLRKKKGYLIGMGLAMGAGLYTYLNFRVFAFFFVLCVLFLLFRRKEKAFLLKMFLFLGSLFLITFPLIYYALVDPQGFWGRSNEISLFSQGFSITEMGREFVHNCYRSLILPFYGIQGQDPPFIGDPNPGKNPAGMPFFDPLTTIIACIGIVFLIRSNRFYLSMILVLFVSAFFSDIFSVEKIPEFHYLGLGHPNTLRMSGIIGAVLLAAGFGLWQIQQFLKARDILFYQAVLPILIGIICFINFSWYFDQLQINKTFSVYNYKVNKAYVTQMIRYMNNSPIKQIAITDVLYQNKSYFDILLNSEIKLTTFTLQSQNDIEKQLKLKRRVAIEINRETVDTVNGFLKRAEFQNGKYSFYEIKGFIDQPDIIIFESR